MSVEVDDYAPGGRYRMRPTPEEEIEERFALERFGPVPQRAKALQKANTVRVKRAEMKRRIKARELEPCAVLIDLPWWMESMRPVDFLMALPHWGSDRAGRNLRVLGISPVRTLGELTDRQRTVLAEAVRT